MKKIITILALLAMSLSLFSVTVDGYAFLEEETDHSGIEVFFQRVAPDTLFSNTVYTDSLGYYSSFVEDGWYDIEYRNSGFISTDTTDVSLYSDQTLNNQTLLSEIFSLSGPISGVLTSGTYTVTDTLYVEENDSLIIEPGTVLNFNSGAYLHIDGFLKAQGTGIDSIYFNGFPDYESSVIYFTVNSDSSFMQYCNVIATELCGISLSSQNTLISNSYILAKEEIGINLRGNNILLENLTIESDNGTAEYGIYMRSGQCLINNCMINNFTQGIDVEDSQINIQNTIIQNTTASILSDNSQIFLNNISIFIKDVCGIMLTNNSNLIVYNSNLFGNGLAMDGINNQSGSIDMNNSNVYGFSTNYNNCGPFIGAIVTTNSNGDPCDAYGNISMDPMLDSNLRLQSGSPCIDAGTNTITDYEFPIAD
ncbi:MAG: right-handed parallel beta-helix repeat-containing protein, partial [Candidatus Delongbacteria bacterium]|nr:right-handed parallel beta-helix repeat-containing protein [Candidatus Delongbacteria bacterium]